MKIIEKKEEHKKNGSIGEPGRSSHFTSRRLKCPNCLSILETEPDDNFHSNCRISEVGGKQGNVWVTTCPVCKYGKLAFWDKHGN